MFLALDAGGTSSRAVVLDAAGRAHGYGRAGCGNPTAAGIRDAVNAIGVAAEQALAGSTGSNRPASALLAMAGEKTPRSESRYRAGLPRSVSGESFSSTTYSASFTPALPRWMDMP